MKTVFTYFVGLNKTKDATSLDIAYIYIEKYLRIETFYLTSLTTVYILHLSMRSSRHKLATGLILLNALLHI